MSEEDKHPLDKTSIIPSDTFKVRLQQAGQAPPSLVMLVGPASSVGRQWELEDTDLIIGRAESCHICVEDRSVSKSHAKITLVAGEVHISDLQSTNKTIINGDIIEPLAPQKLKNNDQVKTGNVIFKFLEEGNIESVSAAQTFDRTQIDSLTEIYNKGALEVKGVEFFRRAELLAAPLSLVTFDIDHFKKVNDTHGHAAGDYILKEVAAEIRNKLIRDNDFFARSGGEEFCLLLLGGEVGQAEDVAERIRTTIENHSFVFQNQPIPITVSAGVSTRVPEDTSWQDIFQRADKALYASKEGGRNKVTVTSSEAS